MNMGISSDNCDIYFIREYDIILQENVAKEKKQWIKIIWIQD
jgi:hypothetical protein